MGTEMTASRSGRINIVLSDRLHHQREEKRVQPNIFFKEIDDVFATFVGLEDVKVTIKQIYATKLINEKRHQLGLKTNKQALHMLFQGNPGTGKTTVARKLATLYQEMGILSKGHFIEVERADLVGEYIGQTAQKTRALIEKSLGGILFIDEAYSLARGGEKDFGKEAIDTLVKHMEDHHEDFVLILAGYRNEMQDFLQTNPGMKSRFPFILDFPNYPLDELMDIAKRMIQAREYKLTLEAELELRLQLVNQMRLQPTHFSNARTVRNLIEKAIRSQSYRLVKQQTDTNETVILMTLTAADFTKND